MNSSFKSKNDSDDSELTDAQIESLRPFAEIFPDLAAGFAKNRGGTSTLVTLRYAIDITRDTNGTWLVTVPDIPGAVTFSQSHDEAIERASEAIQTALMGFASSREPYPEPRASGTYYVTISVKAA